MYGLKSKFSFSHSFGISFHIVLHTHFQKCARVYEIHKYIFSSFFFFIILISRCRRIKLYKMRESKKKKKPAHECRFFRAAQYYIFVEPSPNQTPEYSKVSRLYLLSKIINFTKNFICFFTNLLL